MQNSHNQLVKLRRLITSDAEVLAGLANQKEIFDNVRDFFPHPYRVEDALVFIHACGEENPHLTFGITYQNELAGVIGLVPQTDIYKRSVEIGYWIGKPYWNKGIATAAVNLMSAYAFDELQYLRLYCGVFHTNKSSQRVVEKCGFTLEGIHRKAIIKNNEILDEYCYALINPALEK